MGEYSSADFSGLLITSNVMHRKCTHGEEGSSTPSFRLQDYPLNGPRQGSETECSKDGVLVEVMNRAPFVRVERSWVSFLNV